MDTINEGEEEETKTPINDFPAIVVRQPTGESEIFEEESSFPEPVE